MRLVRKEVGAMIGRHDPRVNENLAKRRKYICLNSLLEDTVTCFKKILKLPVFCSGSLLRMGMAESRTVGVMLVRPADLVVVESNLGMSLFSPFHLFEGLRGQSLMVFAHTEDAEGVVSALQACREGSEGTKLTFRLLRSCYDPASQCLLSKYVTKELTVSHVSPDGAGVLLTCSLSDSDTAPLTASQEFWTAYYKTVATTGRCEFGMATASGIIEALSFGSSLGVERATPGQVPSSNQAGEEQDERPFSPVDKRLEESRGGIMKQMWSDCMGFKDAMGVMMQAAASVYYWVAPDLLGRPRMQGAYRLKHGDFETEWCIYMHYAPTGEKIPFGLGGWSLVNSVRLPEVEGNFEEASVWNFCVKELEEQRGHRCDCTFGFGFSGGVVEMLGHWVVGPARCKHRQSWYAPKGDLSPIPEVEKEMRLLLRSDTTFFKLPFMPRHQAK